jgi:sarcosine oxidase subunit gamma
MADATLLPDLPLAPTHPLEAHRAAFAALSAELAAARCDLAIELEPLTDAVDLRVDPAVVKAGVVDAGGVDPDELADVVGGALPTVPNTWTALADGRAVWLGPDEWLLTGGRPAAGWEEALRAVVGDSGGAAVDVSAQRTGFRLRGTGARALLAQGCALDLRPASFPPGSAAQTLLGQSGVLLTAEDDGFRLAVRTSFAGYVADWLLDATEELRLTKHGSTDQQRAEA